MTKLRFLIILFSILNCSIAFSQWKEVKLYTGYADRFGLAFEYSSDDSTGVEIGSSFYSSKFNYSNLGSSSLDGKWNSLFLNVKLKRYIGNSSFDSRFFYGGYLRYWRYAEFASDMKNWTQDQLDYAADNNVLLSERTHKISIGGLFGVKGKMFKSFTWEISMGGGFSPPFLYFYKSEGTKRTEKGKVGPAAKAEAGDMLPGGYLNHLSLLGHISIGYRF